MIGWPCDGDQVRTHQHNDYESAGPAGAPPGHGRLRTATPVINRGKWWYSAALSEFRPPFLNGAQRSVNRKVQGSNPCPGAKIVQLTKTLTRRPGWLDVRGQETYTSMTMLGTNTGSILIPDVLTASRSTARQIAGNPAGTKAIAK